jgi:hypothetical protein
MAAESLLPHAPGIPASLSSGLCPHRIPRPLGVLEQRSGTDPSRPLRSPAPALATAVHRSV